VPLRKDAADKEFITSVSLCREMTRPENLAACAALLTQFAEACRKGDKAQVMLLHDSLFSETNQVGSSLV
jgi:hypothetical protein